MNTNKEEQNDSEGDSAGTFELPPECREGVEEIIASDFPWNSSKDENGNVTYGKADKIRQVYERYLYEQFREGFDDYARICGKYGRGTAERTEADAKLGNLLQAGDIDIKAVGRALCDDLLRIAPFDRNIIVQLKNFYKFEEPGSPTDLKIHAVYESLGIEKNSAYDFSLWSREWEKDMRGDYMGNYIFGYNGAAFFESFDFDDYRLAMNIAGIANPKLRGVSSGYNKAVDTLRALNPDKTDGEMLCLMGGGGAQLIDDVDLKKYIDSVIQGGWGDNLEDATYASEGINDYYSSQGIDKAEKIEKERSK